LTSAAAENSTAKIEKLLTERHFGMGKEFGFCFQLGDGRFGSWLARKIIQLRHSAFPTIIGTCRICCTTKVSRKSNRRIMCIVIFSEVPLYECRQSLARAKKNAQSVHVANIPSSHVILNPYRLNYQFNEV
jgi:hypothetical protein